MLLEVGWDWRCGAWTDATSVGHQWSAQSSFYATNTNLLYLTISAYPITNVRNPPITLGYSKSYRESRKYYGLEKVCRDDASQCIGNLTIKDWTR